MSSGDLDLHENAACSVVEQSRACDQPHRAARAGQSPSEPIWCPGGLEAQVVRLEPGSHDVAPASPPEPPNLSAVLFPLPLAG